MAFWHIDDEMGKCVKTFKPADDDRLAFDGPTKARKWQGVTHMGG